MIVSSEKAKFTSARVDYRGRLYVTFRVGRGPYTTLAIAEPEWTQEVDFKVKRGKPTKTDIKHKFGAVVVVSPIVSTRPPANGRKRGR